MALDDLKGYVIGVLLFVVVIIGGVVMLGTWYNGDPTLDTTGDIAQFNQSFAKASDVTNSVDSIKSSMDVNENDAGFLGLGWLNALLGSAFTGLKAIYGSLSFMDVVGTEAGALFGIPASIIALIICIAAIIIIFAIWSAITKV